jgi:hypothetical protein
MTRFHEHPVSRCQVYWTRPERWTTVKQILRVPRKYEKLTVQREDCLGKFAVAHLLWNLCGTLKCSQRHTTRTYPSQMQSMPYILHNHFNFFLPTTFVSPKWSVTGRYSNWSFICIYYSRRIRTPEEHQLNSIRPSVLSTRQRINWFPLNFILESFTKIRRHVWVFVEIGHQRSAPYVKTYTRFAFGTVWAGNPNRGIPLPLASCKGQILPKAAELLRFACIS